MDTAKLSQKHAKEQQKLLQEQAAERNALRMKIEQAQYKLERATSTLEKRRIETDELYRLRRELSELPARHESAMNSLKQDQKRELNTLQAEHDKLQAKRDREQLARDLSPMVTDLLREAVQLAQLERTNRRSIPQEEEDGWLFKKKRTVYSSDVLDIPLDVTQTSPGKWAVGGKSPNGCMIKFTVSLERDSFRVSATSDASSHSGSSGPRIIRLSDMSGPKHDTYNLSETALADALLYVMRNVEVVCPCHMDCPCDCDYDDSDCFACHT